MSIHLENEKFQKEKETIIKNMDVDNLINNAKSQLDAVHNK